eukprot:m.141713 g.141713  ORF g.141713 m.141713 type:complete len:61 (+) comp14859_c0_seq4:141-323(+)
MAATCSFETLPFKNSSMGTNVYSPISAGSLDTERIQSLIFDSDISAPTNLIKNYALEQKQ